MGNLYRIEAYLDHESEGWEVQEHAKSIFLESEGLLLKYNMFTNFLRISYRQTMCFDHFHPHTFPNSSQIYYPHLLPALYLVPRPQIPTESNRCGVIYWSMVTPSGTAPLKEPFPSCPFAIL